MNEDILFYAFRYALGRMTYAVSTVADEIKRNAHNITPNLRLLIIKEITQAEASGELGMECDAKLWREARTELQKHV